VKRVRKRHFLKEHSLSLTVAALLTFFVVMYVVSDPTTHAGTFYGNAIADWLGVLVFVVVVVGGLGSLEGAMIVTRGLRESDLFRMITRSCIDQLRQCEPVTA